jgi:hypothetical protein
MKNQMGIALFFARWESREYPCVGAAASTYSTAGFRVKQRDEKTAQNRK